MIGCAFLKSYNSSSNGYILLKVVALQPYCLHLKIVTLMSFSGHSTILNVKSYPNSYISHLDNVTPIVSFLISRMTFSLYGLMKWITDKHITRLGAPLTSFQLIWHILLTKKLVYTLDILVTLH